MNKFLLISVFGILTFNVMAQEKIVQTAVAQTEFFGAAPHFTEKDIIVKFREFRGELTELVAPGSLSYFFLCHNIEC